ncbi:unnamed protein product [Pleuronectes platessa]|uniref:Uncharacterized protein n=1 Tax=Pleuronectes platessa TaxID=8262 RepID=A0A9N7UZK8_PLEPL|nr:unnamed protein product [Pleuronectes platessa]
MAAMCGRSTPLAGNADETSSLYLWVDSPSSNSSNLGCQSLSSTGQWLFVSQRMGQREFYVCDEIRLSSEAEAAEEEEEEEEEEEATCTVYIPIKGLAPRTQPYPRIG